jgi:hypothetical protein
VGHEIPARVLHLHVPSVAAAALAQQVEPNDRAVKASTAPAKIIFDCMAPSEEEIDIRQ